MNQREATNDGVAYVTITNANLRNPQIIHIVVCVILCTNSFLIVTGSDFALQIPGNLINELILNQIEKREIWFMFYYNLTSRKMYGNGFGWHEFDALVQSNIDICMTCIHVEPKLCGKYFYRYI